MWGGKPAVVWKHLAYKMDKIYLNSATIISAVSEEVKEFLMERHPSLDSHRVIVNPNGVDTSRFRYIDSNDVRNNYGIPMEAIVIGYAGNFCPWHRLDLLIRAFQDMEIEGVYLLIIGTGPIELEKNLKSLALRSRPNRIIFTGAVPFSMMPKYLSACDILVSPQSGTFKGKLHQSPIKLYEYMATGRAVIGSRISQISKVIEDGRNGLLFEPDSLQDLKRVLEQAVKDRGLRERIGKQARYDAEQKYSWKANVLRILDAISYQNR
jgi:glycosyltransferase involved in cell wall biosynthesis